MRRSARAALVAAMVLALPGMAGCGDGQAGSSHSASPSPTVPFEVHLTEADDGTDVRLLLGGKVILDLPKTSNWEYDEPEDYADPALATYCPPPSSPGREVFEAVRTGTTTLAYWRDGGPDRFDVDVEIVDGQGAARPSTQLAGAALRTGDDGTTVHVPRNGRILVELAGQHGLGRDWVVAAGDGVAQYCEPERLDDATWMSLLRLTAVAEGTTELVLEYRDPTQPGVAPLDTFRATVVVDPAPAPGASTPTPTGSASAPLELRLSAVDAGGSFPVLAGGTVLVTLPDPHGAEATWGMTSGSAQEDQLGWGCIAEAADSDSETLVLQVGDVLGTAPLVLGYGDTMAVSERDSFAVKLTIVGGPGALTPTAKLPRVSLTEKDARRTVTVPRNSAVSVQLPGQHGLGLDWVLVEAGAGLRDYCPRWFFSEGPGPDDMIVGNVFPFVAVDPGTAHVVAEYRDTNDPGSEPLDSFEVTVVVE